MSFRKNFARARKIKKLTQAEVARQMGISRPLVCQIERGHRKPYPKFCRDAATVLGIDQEELMAR